MPNKINLLGQTEKKKRSESTGAESSALLPVLLMVAYGICFFSLLYYPLTQEVAQKQQDILLLDKKISEVPEHVKDNKTSTASLKSKIDQGEASLSDIAELKSKRNNAMFTLASIHNNIPDEVWIDSLNLEGNVVTLKGRSTVSEAVFNFNKSLDSLAEFKTSKVASIAGSGDQTAGTPMVEYVITIEMKSIFDL